MSSQGSGTPRFTRRQRWRFLAAPLSVVLPRATLEPIAGIVLLVANLFSAGAVLVFVFRLVKEDAGGRRAARLPLIVAALLGAGVLALLGRSGVLAGLPEAWNLVLGLIPICLAFALTSRRVEPLPEHESR